MPQTLVESVQISRRCVAKRTSEINRELRSIGNYCADRAEVCPNANLHVVNTVQIAWRCVAQQTSVANMIIFRSYLDLHLSESDWCRIVVRFWLSYLD